ncbi:MAG: 2TM domain-containing protein [Bacteroidales bacterium]|jgi:hypothetical protein
MENSENRNQELWELASARAGFKVHLTVYILVNLSLWGIWYFLTIITEEKTFSYWPIYPMLSWGIGLLFHYMRVYHWTNNWTEKEYEKLLKKKQNKQLE